MTDLPDKAVEAVEVASRGMELETGEEQAQVALGAALAQAFTAEEWDDIREQITKGSRVWLRGGFVDKARFVKPCPVVPYYVRRAHR